MRFTLNGEPAHADASDPALSLLQWLRARGLSGTKEGCAEGECGACAVAFRRTDAQGRPHYEAINSCLLPLACVEGQDLTTVEGVADPGGALHPVQRALVEQGGSQCGYCTPGFVISLFCEYYRPDRDEFDLEAIAGNLCRCTGYRPIIDAARLLAKPAADDRRIAGATATPSSPSSSPAPSPHFSRPPHLASLFQTQAAHPDATLIAGGTDLMVEVNQRNARFERFISLEAVRELKQFGCTPDEISIGAGLTLTQITERLAESAVSLPLFDQLLPLFSSRLIRNRATLGGNLQTASPIGDAAPCLLALDAALSLVSAQGTRRVPLSAFFEGYRKTALKTGELILRVHIPRPAAPIQRFYKVSKRRLDDISTVAAAFALELDAQNQIVRLRIAYGGIAATPLRALAVEQLAQGKPYSEQTRALLVDTLAQVGTPLSDQRGSAAYRRAMIERLFSKFWLEQRTREHTP